MRRHFRFNISQMLLLTALVGLILALISTVYQRMSGTFAPESVSLSPDGGAVAARFTNGSVIAWNRSGKRLGSFDSRAGLINWNKKRAFQLIDPQTVIVSNDRSQFEVWNLGADGPIHTFGRTAPMLVGDMAVVSRDGKTAAAVRIGATSGIEIWDVQTQQPRELPGGNRSAMGLALSDDGSRLAVVDTQGDATVVDAATGEAIFTDTSGNTQLPFRAFSADMSHWAAVGTDYSSSTLKMQAYVVSDDMQFTTDVDDYPSAMALSPDGKFLALLTGGQLKVFDTAGDSPQPPREIELASGTENPFAVLFNYSATDVEFSPDGRKLLVASAGEVVLLDVTTLRRDKVYWRIGHDRGIWFFLPAFIGWSVLWGLARRRQTLSERTAAASPTGVDVSTFDRTTPDALPKPPVEIIVVWVMMGIGGLLAIGWSMWMTLWQDSCLAITPFPYIGLFVGITALSSAAGRRTAGLTRVGILQIVSMVCCDAINLTFGVISLILINQTGARRFLKEMNHPGERGT